VKAQPLPLIGGFYADETRPWSQQDICNWLPVAAESDGTRTPTMAKTPPGLSPFARISGDPSRGVYDAEGRLFTVMGNTLYQITPTTAIALGSISGTGRVRFAHNQITGGNQVLIVNGSAGWVWNTVTSTLTLITDTGYPGAINARFIDGYLIQIEPARRYAFHSDLADALAYNTLDRFTSEVSPDLLVSMAVSNNELILFSERTAEFFENTGASQQPFRSKRISFNKGCAGRYTVAEMDNTVFWLGDDGAFYLLNGYNPQRISTRPIEQAIRGLNWAQAFAFVWEDSGHSVCYWTFPDGMTFGYDASQQKWHRRESYGFDRWRVQDLAYWQNRWIAGDFQKGRLWEMDWTYPYEYDEEFVSQITSPVIHDNQSRLLMPRLEVVMDTGMPGVAIRDFVIDVAALSITGDLPDGTVGDEGTMQYVVTGGVPPYGTITILSGSLPPGATMATDGLVTYTYTTIGSYSWMVKVVDSDGNVAATPDTAVVSAIPWAATFTVSTSGTFKISPTGDDWSAPPTMPTIDSDPVWNPGGGSTLTYHSGDLLMVTSVPNGTSYKVVLRAIDGSYSLPEIDDFFIDSVSKNAVYTGAAWMIGAQKVFKSTTGAAFTDASPTYGYGITKTSTHAVVCGTGFQSQLNIRTFLPDGSGETVTGYPASALNFSAADLASDGSTVAFFGTDLTSANEIWASSDQGATWAQKTCPVPWVIGMRPCAHYGMGRWWMVLGTRIAHGLTLDALALDAHTFPGVAQGIGSDNEKVIVCGEGGMLQKWTISDGWSALTSGVSTTIWDVEALHD
jgi:Phage stabilisation protein